MSQSPALFDADDVRRDVAAASEVMRSLDALADGVAALVSTTCDVFRAGGRVLACGNGGSASDAEHTVTELVGRFYLDRPPLDALALTTNSSLTTALANDYGFDDVFARQVHAHGRPGDVLLVFTTSGRSNNVIRAAEAARERGVRTVAFTGAKGAAFAAECDVAFVVPSEDTPRIQEAHILLAHVFCRGVETLMFGSRP